MQIPDLTDISWFFVTLGLLFIIIAGRYFIIAGIFYLFFHRIRSKSLYQRKISVKNYTGSQFRKEVMWSMTSALIFSLSGTFLLLGWQLNKTMIYTRLDDFGLWYLPFSIIIFLIIHETYYYWLHRWMHHPKIFKIVHSVHHESNITSPFTAFSFHPIESILQAVFLPLVLMLIPMHFSVVLTLLMVMTLSSVINHLNIEIYPEKFNKHFIGRWLIGATHHSLHHSQFKYNYGLYFTFWDKFRKTESPVYDQTFEKVTGNINQELRQQETL